MKRNSVRHSGGPGTQDGEGSRLLLLAVAIALLIGPAAGRLWCQAKAADSVVAFVGVNLISMVTNDVQAKQTVIVRGNLIAAVGPSDRVSVPQGARRVDGSGKYLMPGLADFHVHLAQRADLAAYLASGVTTLANMGSPGRSIIAWRDSIRAGQMLGPDLYAGYYVNGPTRQGGGMTVETTDQARAAVVEADTAGFDFIKVYNSLTAEQYGAILEEAKARHLPVLGHAVRAIGLEKGFAAGQVAVVHAEEYMYADLNRRLDTTLIPMAVAFTKGPGAYVVPNLSAFEAITRQWGKPAQLDSFFAKPEARYLSPYWRTRWQGADYVRRTGTLTALPFLMHLTLGLQRGGVPLLLGTDSPTIPGLFPGVSIHEDIRLLIEAGLTPYEALVAGTRTPGEFSRRFFRRAEAFGTIAPGQRADLILLEGNPLENPATARVPLGVMARGHWLDAGRLAALREEAGRGS
ncbi:MAG: amidohydrolase [Gemmatimonadota bacterium]